MIALLNGKVNKRRSFPRLLISRMRTPCTWDSRKRKTSLVHGDNKPMINVSLSLLLWQSGTQCMLHSRT
jgi:hypothetical protein